jgi:hypothetical protein
MHIDSFDMNISFFLLGLSFKFFEEYNSFWDSAKLLFLAFYNAS